MSADGKIASKSYESHLSCPFDKRRLHELRASHDAVAVGANTVIKDNPELTVRFVKGKNPTRVIIDGKLRSPLNSKVFNVSLAPTVLITSPIAPPEKIEQLRKRGITIINIKASRGKIPLKVALRKLHELGIRTLLVEGGGNLIWNFFHEGLVDEYRVTISPFIIGGRKAITPVEGSGFAKLKEWVRLELVNYFLCECGEEVHLVYKVCLF